MKDKYYNNIIFPFFVGISVIIIFLFYFSFTSNDKVVGLIGDDAVYLLQADLYSPWKKEITPAAEHIRSISYFPPIFPITLSLFGANSDNLILSSRINTVCLILSLIFIGYFSYIVTKSKITTIVLPIFVAFLPKSLLLSQALNSEFLFMCFLYTSFILLDKNKLTSRHWLLAALIISLASLTRSIGVSLILSLALFLLIKRPKHFYKYVLVSCIPFIAWMMSRYLLSGHNNYVNHFIEASGTSHDLLNIIKHKFIIYINTWHLLLTGKGNDNVFFQVTIIILLILSVIGFYFRLKQLKFDSFFLPIYLLILLAWPYNDLFHTTRFIYPIYPLLLLYIFISIQRLIQVKVYRNIMYTLTICFIFTSSFPVSSQYIERGFFNMDPALKAYSRTGIWLDMDSIDDAYVNISTIKTIVELLPQVKNYVPENKCIYSIHAALVTLYTHRKSIEYPPINDSFDEFEDHTLACEYYLAMPTSGKTINRSIYYPLNMIVDNQNYEIIPISHDLNKKNKASLLLIKRR